MAHVDRSEVCATSRTFLHISQLVTMAEIRFIALVSIS